MTPKQREIIERARREPARFVDIPREKRTTRGTAQDNMNARLIAEGKKPIEIGSLKVPNGPPLGAERLMRIAREARNKNTASELLTKEHRRLQRTWNR
jgi:hypothetical protein